MDELLRGGLITQERYREVMMYDEATQEFRRKHYVPQRGWAFESYLDETMFADAMKAAKGRETLATSPLSYIEIIAKSAIMGAERNLAKQKLYNLAKEHSKELSKQGNALQMARMYEFTAYDGACSVSEEYTLRNDDIKSRLTAVRLKIYAISTLIVRRTAVRLYNNIHPTCYFHPLFETSYQIKLLYN